jgi:hypothetical protein
VDFPEPDGPRTASDSPAESSIGATRSSKMVVEAVVEVVVEAVVGA